MTDLGVVILDSASIEVKLHMEAVVAVLTEEFLYGHLSYVISLGETVSATVIKIGSSGRTQFIVHAVSDISLRKIIRKCFEY